MLSHIRTPSTVPRGALLVPVASKRPSAPEIEGEGESLRLIRKHGGYAERLRSISMGEAGRGILRQTDLSVVVPLNSAPTRLLTILRITSHDGGCVAHRDRPRAVRTIGAWSHIVA